MLLITAYFSAVLIFSSTDTVHGGDLSKLQGKADVKDVWAAVRQMTGRDRHEAVVDGVDAHSLNVHCALCQHIH